MTNAHSSPVSDEYRYARELLVSFVNEHCDPVPEWKPNDDLMGILSQFDNALTVVRSIKAGFDPKRSSAGSEELADELDRKLEAFIYARDEGNERVVSEVALRNALWDNKAGIIAYLRSRHAAQPLPKRIPVELTESAHRLWMCINGHDINDFYERAEFILRTSLDGMQVGPDNRATVKSLLVEHFEQIAKASTLSSTQSEPGK